MGTVPRGFDGASLGQRPISKFWPFLQARLLPASYIQVASSLIAHSQQGAIKRAANDVGGLRQSARLYGSASAAYCFNTFSEQPVS